MFLRFTEITVFGGFWYSSLSVNRISTFEGADLPNSQGSQLLDQAIMDLKMAADLLPESWDANNLGRATKIPLMGFLMRLLVIRGNVYNQSTDFTDAVAAGNINASLVSRYGDNSRNH